MALYLLLIVPHLAAITGLLLYALRSNPTDEGEEAQGGWFGLDGDPTPPEPPLPAPSGVSPPAPREVSPRHRIRDADHAKRPARRPRREHPEERPERVPKAPAGAQAR